MNSIITLKLNKRCSNLCSRQKLSAVIASLLMVAGLPANAYEIVDLGVGVEPAAINNNGTVVGSQLQGTVRKAVKIVRNGQLEALPDGVFATDINDNEWIVGKSSSAGFYYKDGQWMVLDDGTSANAINSYGLIAASYPGINPYRPTPLPLDPARYDIEANGQPWQIMNIAQVYPRGTRQGIYADLYAMTDINDVGFMVGVKSRYGLVGTAAIAIAPEFQEVKYLTNMVRASAISNTNLVVGTYWNNHAGVYDLVTNSQADMGTLNGGLRSTANGINNSNKVVGSAWLSTVETSENDPTLYHAFYWDAFGGMKDLNNSITDTSWLLTSASDINDFGEIVGVGIKNGVSHGFMLTSIAPPPPHNNPPVAAITADPYAGKAPLAVTFSGVPSYDPDGTPLTYLWQFGDGTTATGQVVSHLYTKPGRYTAALTVSDGQDSDTETVLIKAWRGRN